jgi:transposase InsO family protein
MVHISSSSSSASAKRALEKIIERFGEQVIIVNDNGSENKGKAMEMLASREITQYFARPRRPKDKPFIERFIGTLQKECLDYHYEPLNVTELREVVDAWLDVYHFYRPHEALNFMTPGQYCDKLGISIPHSKNVS